MRWMQRSGLSLINADGDHTVDDDLAASPLPINQRIQPMSAS